MAPKDTRSPTSWKGAAEPFRHYLMPPTPTPVPGQTLAIVSDIVQKAKAQLLIGNLLGAARRDAKDSHSVSPVGTLTLEVPGAQALAQDISYKHRIQEGL